MNAHLASWFVRQEAQQRCGGKPNRLVAEPTKPGTHLAIDGKALKGTGKQASGGDDPQKHLLHIYEVQTGVVLEQGPIPTKNNEVSALKPLLTETLCKGRILTADAAQSYHNVPFWRPRAFMPGRKESCPQTAILTKVGVYEILSAWTEQLWYN